jgi:hypothetical protein
MNIAVLLLISTLGQCGPGGCYNYNIPQYNYAPQPRVQPRIQPRIQPRLQQSQIRDMMKFDPNIVLVEGLTNTPSAVGNGFVVALGEDFCWVMTCSHMLPGMSSFNVYFSNGRRSEAEVIAQEASLDAAILKCEDKRPYKTKVQFTLSDTPANTPVQWTAWKTTYPNGKRRSMQQYRQGVITDNSGPFFKYSAIPFDGASGAPIFTYTTNCAIVGMVINRGPIDGESPKGRHLYEFLMQTISKQKKPEQNDLPLPHPKQEDRVIQTEELVKVERVEKLESRIASIEGRLQDGKDGKDGKDAEITDEIINEITARASNGLKLQLAMEMERLLPEVIRRTREEVINNLPQQQDIDPIALKEEVRNEVMQNLPNVVTDIKLSNGSVIRKRVKLGEPTVLTVNELFLQKRK